MKATVLITNPFLIPVGSKVRLVRNDGFTVEGFFYGYKTYGQECLQFMTDKFPLFKAVKKDGTMGNKYPKNLSGGTLGSYDLKDYELEVLEFASGIPGWDNKYCDVICSAVAACTAEMLAYAKDKGITHLDLTEDPDVDEAYATFEVEDSEACYEKVITLEFNQNKKTITVFGANGESGYLDDTYGDYFDVAHSTPKIYKAFCQIIRKRYYAVLCDKN